MITIVIAYGHDCPVVDVKGYNALRSDDFDRLGKELALFLYYNTPGGFWRGVQQVAKEISSLSFDNDENATHKHFLCEPQQADEEEAVFE